MMDTTTAVPISTEITFGPTHHIELAAFIREACGPVVATSTYVKPYFVAYQLPSGKVAKVTEKVFSSYVTVFDSYADFRASENAAWGSYDPETGRGRR